MGFFFNSAVLIDTLKPVLPLVKHVLKPFFELEQQQAGEKPTEVEVPPDTETEQEDDAALADVLDPDLNDQNLMLDLEALLGGGAEATRTFLCDACGKLQSNVTFDDDQTA